MAGLPFIEGDQDRDHFPDALLPRQEYPARERGGRRIDAGQGGWKGVWMENAIGAKMAESPEGEAAFIFLY